MTQFRGIQSREFATVQMIMKMEGQCRVTFQFPSDFDREVGQTFKVFGRFKVILSEKFVEEATEVTGNVIARTIRVQRWNSFENWNQGTR